jgi:hypothetical protein
MASKTGQKNLTPFRNSLQKGLLQNVHNLGKSRIIVVKSPGDISPLATRRTFNAEARSEISPGLF